MTDPWVAFCRLPPDTAGTFLYLLSTSTSHVDFLMGLDAALLAAGFTSSCDTPPPTTPSRPSPSTYEPFEPRRLADDKDVSPLTRSAVATRTAEAAAAALAAANDKIRRHEAVWEVQVKKQAKHGTVRRMPPARAPRERIRCPH